MIRIFISARIVSESIVDLSEIDSQIYFTFHQCLLKLRKENKFGSRYDSRKQLQDKMEIALNNLYTHFTIQDSSLLSEILLDIDELVETTYHEYSYSLLKPVNHVVRYVLHPIYEVVDDLYQRYRLYYNAYHYIVYNQRLDKPYINNKSKFTSCDWDAAIQVFSKKLKEFKEEDIVVMSGPLVDVETLYVAKKLFSNFSVVSKIITYSQPCLYINDSGLFIDIKI